jgi:Fic-DOC domain mobile mystery protein B
VTEALFEADDDANTPLTPLEREGLIPTYIATRAELNDAEQANIGEADRWAFSHKRGDLLTPPFLLRLHRRMFGPVWRWAGGIRDTERNIGIAPYLIEAELRRLTDDTRYWIEHRSFEPDEIALRFHHRLVAIHPFPNGNGRHARMAADLLAVQLGRQRFTWGSANLVTAAATRRQYVEALRAADGHDIRPLLAFARS